MICSIVLPVILLFVTLWSHPLSSAAEERGSEDGPISANSEEAALLTSLWRTYHRVIHSSLPSPHRPERLAANEATEEENKQLWQRCVTYGSRHFTSHKLKIHNDQKQEPGMHSCARGSAVHRNLLAFRALWPLYSTRAGRGLPASPADAASHKPSQISRCLVTAGAQGIELLLNFPGNSTSFPLLFSSILH